MHASIPWIFVSTNHESTLQRIGFRRYLNRYLIAMIFGSAMGCSPALAQNTYLGKWNSPVDNVKPGDQIPRLSEAQNRTLKPSRLFQDIQSDEARSFPTPSLNHPEAQPRPFQPLEDVPLLIPETPSEESFTAEESSIKGSPFFGADSPPAGNPTSVHQNELQDASHQRGLNLVGSSDQVTDPNRLVAEAASERAFVQATTFEEPFQSSPSALSSNLADTSLSPSSVEPACRWIDQYLVSSNPGPAGLSYQPVSLVELFRQPIAVNQRPEMIVQYWETWSQWAELSSRIQFANWISSITAANSPAESQFLTTSKQHAENQVLEARTFLSNAQSRLQLFMLPAPTSSAATHQPPLPSDNPLIHPYVSNYQLYQKYRSMPEKFQNIDRDLQDNLNRIVKQAQTVESAKSTAESQVGLYQNGRANLSSVVAAGQTWRSAEMNLIRTVAQYNQRIAEYSLNVTDGRHAPETVAAMLIGKSGNKRAMAGRNIRPDSKFQSALNPPYTQHETLDPNRQSAQSFTENANGFKSPVSSSLSQRRSQPSSEPTRFQDYAAFPREISRATRPADPFRQNGSVTQLGNQSFESGPEAHESSEPFQRGEGRSLSDRTAVSPEPAPFAVRTPSSMLERNHQELSSSRLSSDNSTNVPAQPGLDSGSGTSGDFRPSSRLPDPNPTGLSSDLARSEKFNPLKPLPNPARSNSNPPVGNDVPLRGANPSNSDGFDRFKSSGSSINPPLAPIRSNEGSSGSASGLSNPTEANPREANPQGLSNQGGSANPANGMFRPTDFNPSSRPPGRDASRNPSSEFNAAPSENIEPSTRQILPPENTVDSGGKQDP